MAQQSLSVQGVFKNQRERAAGQINGKAFAPEIDIKLATLASGAFFAASSDLESR